jgi:uncharacterized protein (DUF2267 family)
LAEINEIVGSTGNDPALDSLLQRFHIGTACRRGGALALRACDLGQVEVLVRLREKWESLVRHRLEKTNGVLKRIEEAYGWPKEQRNLSYNGMRAVLHAVRDRLTVEEAAQLSAQLPMLIRGIYFEGWDPSRVPMKTHRDEFLARIRKEFPYEAPGGIERLFDKVVQALRRHITEGEWEDVRANLPKDVVAVLP